MNQLKFLSNLALVGVASSISVVSSILVAPSVSAQEADDCFFGDFANVPAATNQCVSGTILEAGDKTVTLDQINFTGLDPLGRDPSGVIDFEDFAFAPPGPLGDQFILDVVFESVDPSTDPPTIFEGISNATDGLLSYTIEIDDPDLTFDLVSLDSSIGLDPGVQVTKEIFTEEGGTSLGTLMSIDGNDSGPSFVDLTSLDLQSLYIVDTYSTTDNGVLLEFDNAFSQEDGSFPIPEPASILGLLVIGGLGLGLKRKKQP